MNLAIKLEESQNESILNSGQKIGFGIDDPWGVTERLWVRGQNCIPPSKNLLETVPVIKVFKVGSPIHDRYNTLERLNLLPQEDIPSTVAVSLNPLTFLESTQPVKFLESEAQSNDFSLNPNGNGSGVLVEKVQILKMQEKNTVPLDYDDSSPKPRWHNLENSVNDMHKRINSKHVVTKVEKEYIFDQNGNSGFLIKRIGFVYWPAINDQGKDTI
jgi:hypothetical protein